MKKVIIISMAILSISNLVYAEEEILASVISKPKPAHIIKKSLFNNILPLDFYISGGLTSARFDPNCACSSAKGDSDSTTGVIGKIGYDFHPFIGVEARIIRTNWASDGGKVKHFGLFLKPMYPVSHKINIYTLVGYAKTITQGSKQHVNAATLAWGTGIEYALGEGISREEECAKNIDPEKKTSQDKECTQDFDVDFEREDGWKLFIDYERLVQKSGSPDLDTVNMGISYQF